MVISGRVFIQGAPSKRKGRCSGYDVKTNGFPMILPPEGARCFVFFECFDSILQRRAPASVRGALLYRMLLKFGVDFGYMYVFFCFLAPFDAIRLGNVPTRPARGIGPRHRRVAMSNGLRRAASAKLDVEWPVWDSSRDHRGILFLSPIGVWVEGTFFDSSRDPSGIIIPPRPLRDP